MWIEPKMAYWQTSIIEEDKLLDKISSCTIGLALRKIRKNYTGNCIRVRRDSDNTEQDIGFTASGDLNTEALLNFVGVGDGYVKTWYDQSEKTKNFTQTVNADQPKIVESGSVIKKNNRPTIMFSTTHLVCDNRPVTDFHTSSNYILSSIVYKPKIKSLSTNILTTLYATNTTDLDIAQGIYNGNFDIKSSKTPSYEINYVYPQVNFDKLQNWMSICTNNEMNFNINNKLANSKTGALTLATTGNTTKIYIGRWNTVNTNYNYISEVLHFNNTINTDTLYKNQNSYFKMEYYPLDEVINPSCAYALRKLRSEYMGSAIRVRRSSDNTEQDIGFESFGDLDENALLTFTGNGTTNQGYVTKWYDQSFYSMHITQSTVAQQPQIVKNGVVNKLNNKPSVFFENTTRLGLSTGIKYSDYDTGNMSIFYVYSNNTGGNNGGTTLYMHDNTGQPRICIVPQQYYDIGSSSSNRFSTTHINPMFDLLQQNTIIKDNLIQYLNINGENKNKSSCTLTNSTNASNFVIGIDVSGGVSNAFGGFISEAIIYNSSKLLQKDTLELNQLSYFGINNQLYQQANTGQKTVTPMTNCTGAFSLRRINPSYMGYAVRVRRDDDVEKDIGFDKDGNFDKIGFKNFVGSSKGYVKTWYNQSDATSTAHATQTDKVKQPIIKINDKGLTKHNNPTLYFDGSDDWMTVPIDINRTNTPNATLIFNYNTRGKVSGNEGSVLFSNDASTLGWCRWLHFSFGNDVKNAVNNGATDGWATIPDLNPQTPSVLSVKYNCGVTNGSTVYVNGVSKVTFTEYVGNAGATSFLIGALEATKRRESDIELTEFMVFNTILNDDTRTFIENDMLKYNNTKVSELDKANGLFSLRRLNYNYNGSPIQVRRSSDNTTKDIGFNANGDLNTQELLDFVGTTSTSQGYISIIYNQTGDNNNLVQPTTTSQAQIVSNGKVITTGGKPTILYSGGQGYDSTTNMDIGSQFVTFKYRDGWQKTFGTDTYPALTSSATTMNYCEIQGETGGNKNEILTNATIHDLCRINKIPSTVSKIVLPTGQNKLIITTQPTILTGQKFRVGFEFESGRLWNGTISEIITYSTKKTLSEISQVEDDIMKYYNIPTITPKSELNEKKLLGVWTLNNNVNKNYQGASIRVVRESDLVEKDIYLVYGRLDINSLVTFGGTSKLTVKTIYDKSGNNLHATQTDRTKQPTIYNYTTGGLVMCDFEVGMLFDGVDDFLQISNLDIDVNKGISISTNIKYSAFNNYARICEFALAAYDKSAIFFANRTTTSKIVLGYCDNTGLITENQSFDAVLNTKYNISCTLNPSYLEVYKNNSETFTIENAKTIVGGTRINNYIGKSSWTTTNYLSAIMTGLVVYNDTLNNDEFNQLKQQELIFDSEYLPIRYIRDWGNGNSLNIGTHWTEIQAFDVNNNNIALNCSSSIKSGFTVDATTGALTVLTDGVVSNVSNANYVSALPHATLCYIQVDLGYITTNLEKIKVWHFYIDTRYYKNTKTEVSADGVNWYTVFDSSIQGTYIETTTGKTIGCKKRDVLK